MRRLAVAAGAAILLAMTAPSANAQDDCPRTVIFTLPSTTWADVERVRPRNIMQAAADGALGSMSVRTITARTSLADGFLSIGAGARVEGGDATGGPAYGHTGDGTFSEEVEVAGLEFVRATLDRVGYSTVRPGALASALPHPVIPVGNADLGSPPPSPLGYGRWTLLAAMTEGAVVPLAATGTELTTGEGLDMRTDAERVADAVDEAMEVGCSSLVIDHGDLARVDYLETLARSTLHDARRDALLAADDLLGQVRTLLDPDEDLLLVVSPTSPTVERNTHFGVAIAVGPAFPRGSSLESSSTQRPGIVTLTDIAPTVLRHVGAERPASMIGRSWFSVEPVARDRIAAALRLDRESVFIDNARTPVATVFVVVQVFIYGLILFALWLRQRRGLPAVRGPLGGGLELAALAVVAFPVATNLMGLFDQHALGVAGFVAIMIGIDVALVALSTFAGSRPLDRLLFLSAFTLAVLLADTIVGAPLQLNTVFSYSPIVAGRFAGVGNIVFSMLMATALICATLIVHHERGSPKALWGAAAIFAVTIVVDAAPGWGSDVGGLLALVPGFIVAWWLLAGRRISWTTLGIAAVALLGASAAFLAWDISRPPEARTHLARLFEDVRGEGFEVFGNTINRKISANLRVFRSTIWTYLVPPALAFIALLVVRPVGRWRRLAEAYPKIRAGLIAGLVLAVLGFAVNDSGIVIPAIMLSYLVPMTLLVHLTMERDAEPA